MCSEVNLVFLSKPFIDLVVECVLKDQSRILKIKKKTRSDLIFLLKDFCRSQWPHDLRRRSAAARLLTLWVRFPSGAWMSYESVVYCQGSVPASG